MEDALLDTPTAADRLGLKPATLETWRWSGKGPPFLKLGGRVRYRQQDLNRWLEGCVRRSTSDHGDAVKADDGDAHR